jgi:hypothetical protein
MEIGTLFGKLKRSSQQQQQQQHQQQQQQQQQSNKIELSIPSDSNISNNLFNPTQIPTQSDIYQLLVSMKAEFHHLRDSVKILGEKLDKLDNPRDCSSIQSSLSDSVSSSE